MYIRDILNGFGEIMTACIIVKTQKDLEKDNIKDANIMKNITDSIKRTNLELETGKEKIYDSDYEKILRLTTSSFKMYANTCYKSTPSIEASDIEEIKTALKNHTNNNKNVVELKTALIKDLTDFQAQIKTNHEQKLIDLKKQKELYEKQIKIYDIEKNKLIMDRLSKIVWPYDEKTKSYDSKIAALEIQRQQLTQKITDFKQTTPAANEKDILLYQMSLKEKYARK